MLGSIGQGGHSHRRLGRDAAHLLHGLIGFLALAVPLLTGTLGLASGLANDSRVKTDVMMHTYATMGGVQHLQDRLVYETGWAESLPLDTAVSYVVTLNSIPVTVTVVKKSEPPPPPQVPPGVSNRAFSITKSVFPATQTTYIYTATINNGTDTTKSITQIKDSFPSGLSYVAGSTSGFTTVEPSIVSGELRWNLTGTQGDFAPYTSKVMQFQMQGSLPQGVYCNDIYVAPGGDKTRSGLTAKIIVGSPGTTLCTGTAIRFVKTVSPAVVPANTVTTLTYTLTFTSDGTLSSNLSKVVDLMPAGFTYVPGSTQGLTTANPNIVLKNNGTQQELTWSANPIGVIPSGQVKTMSFQAIAAVTANDYYNEATATVSGLNYDLYTWPTARVQIMGVFDLAAATSKTSTSSNLWLGTDSATLRASGSGAWPAR